MKREKDLVLKAALRIFNGESQYSCGAMAVVLMSCTIGEFHMLMFNYRDMYAFPRYEKTRQANERFDGCTAAETKLARTLMLLLYRETL